MSKRPSLKGFPRDGAHISEVYAYYQERSPHRVAASFSLRVLGAVLRPQVSHRDGSAIRGHLSEGGLFVIAGNHKRTLDPFIFAAAVGRDVDVLRHLELPDPETRILAKLSLFNSKVPGVRFFIDAMGAIPVARRKDADTELGQASRRRLCETSTSIVASGSHVMLYPEETRLEKLKPGEKPTSKMGVGIIAVDAAAQRQPGDVRVLPVAVDYTDASMFGVRVHTGESFAVEPYFTQSDEERTSAIKEVHDQTMTAIRDAEAYMAAE